MKYIILVLVHVCLGSFTYSQDTLINNLGERLTGFIVEELDGYISFRGELSEEINLIDINQLLLIKQANNPANVLFKNDTMITKNGVIIPAKILAISPDSITFFPNNGRIQSPISTDFKNILLIKYSNGTTENLSDFSKQFALQNDQLIGLAQSDARMYYKTPPGVIVGEVLLGISSVIFYPIVAGITIACVKPTKLDNPLNPNNALIYSKPEYKTAYAKQAKKRKTKDALISYFSGLAGIIGTIYILVQ